MILPVKCRWCQEPLTYLPEKGWVHPDGHSHKGRCLCPDSPHAYSHDGQGRLICPTWRDDHTAQPYRG